MKKEKTVSRKRFVSWGLAISGMVAFPAFSFLWRKKEKPAGTVKMLGQDGKLVEVELSRLRKGKRIKNTEIHNWIRNKES